MSKLFIAVSLGFLLGCCALWPASAQQGSEQQPIRSPGVVALEKQLKPGDSAVLDNFWSEVKQQGTPLVEPISGDDKHVLVTFLWRGETETKNVGLFCYLFGGAGEAPENNLLVNLPGTNVWFKTYAVHKGGRFTYYFSPNDSLLPYDQRKDKDWDTLQPDPLNPHHFVTHYEQGDKVSSVVELPGAAAVPAWLKARAGCPKRTHRGPTPEQQDSRQRTPLLGLHTAWLHCGRQTLRPFGAI